MSAPIDELLVRLGLETDAKGFKEANNQFTNLRTTALATGAGIAAAFAGAVKMSDGVARSADELAKWSRQAGVTAQYASKLGFAMKQVGGSDADALGLVELANSLRDSAQWGELADRAFTAAGFNPQQIHQENMSPEEVIDFLSQGLSAMDRDTARQIAQTLGVSDISRRLLTDRAGMQSNFQRAGELGGVPSDELLANSEAYVTATTELKESMDGFRQFAANEMLPGMTNLVKGITGWSIENRDEAEESFKEALPFIKVTAAGIAALVAAQLGKKAALLMVANLPLAAAAAMAAFVVTNWEEGNKNTLDGLNNIKRGLLGVDDDDPRFIPADEPYLQRLEGYDEDVPIIPGDYRHGLDQSDVPVVPGDPRLGRLPDTPDTKAYIDALNENLSRESAMFEALLGSVIVQESRGKHRDKDGSLTRSPMGALGVSQVMPTTGRDPGYGVKPLQDDSEEEYVRFGRDYLAAMLKLFDGDTRKALAAYNGGPGNVGKAIDSHGPDWLSAMKPETQNYVPEVLSRVNQGPPDFFTSNPQASAGPTNYYSIDARGSTDPAATADAVRRVVDERIASAVQIGMDDFPSNVK